MDWFCYLIKGEDPVIPVQEFNTITARLEVVLKNNV
jgi:hypothetical protein